MRVAENGSIDCLTGEAIKSNGILIAHFFGLMKTFIGETVTLWFLNDLWPTLHNSKPIVYLVAPDEGHGFARSINNLAMVTAMEKFFAPYLKGRFQSGAPGDVAAKLVEVTVDPTSVRATVRLTPSGAQ